VADPSNPTSRHFTQRHGFVILMGLLILTLYFVWAAFGAAPTSLSFLDESEAEAEAEAMVMGGGMTPDRFREITDQFVEDLSLPDGSVQPSPLWKADLTEHESPAAAMTPEVAARMAADIKAAAASVAEREKLAGHSHGEDGEPVDVFLMAERFAYTPSVLRLKHGVPYRFRMMSVDVNHGVSVNTGSAGHIMRRPAQTMVETVMIFPKRGEFMMYCTVYCGLGHGQMKGKIIVE